MARRPKSNLVCVSNPYKTIIPALEGALAECLSEKKFGGLLTISIDNLAMIISGQGGIFAEEMMEDLTRQIGKSLRKRDVALRVDKDHINVLLVDYPASEIDGVATSVSNHIRNYGCLTSVEPIQLTYTIGGVCFPEDCDNANGILNRAYIAHNDAVEGHLQYVCYGDDKKHKTESINQMILANYIQNAFLNDKLCLAYQPIINTKTGVTAYYECLLRVINEDGGLSSAGPFIPVAEKMGFINMIDGLVLQKAVKELHNCEDVCLAINVSNTTIHNSDWLLLATKLLKDKKIASRLIVEITETSELHDMKKAGYFVEVLQSLGCKVALDDFGSGYTSFSQLKSLPVDIIKIDGTFVRNMADSPESRFFVQTLLEFSRRFHLQAVAEFVENEEIANILGEMNVDFMQGNYFSPAVDHREWLEN